MTAKGSRHAFGMAKARVRSVPTGVCMSTPLRPGAALDMMHFDGREVALDPSLVQEMRALSEVPYVVSTFWMQRGPGRRLGGAKVSMRSVSVHVWVVAPLTTRVTLNMMDFAGREVGRSAKSFEVPHVSSTHRLRAKGSRDASLRVESTRVWRFCGCVRGRATPGPSNARDNAFGWASGWFNIYLYLIIYISISNINMNMLMQH